MGDRRQAGIGRGNAYIIDRLWRDDPAMAARIEAGELSPYAAAMAKDWRKPQNALTQLKRWWDKASLEERLAFQDYVNR